MELHCISVEARLPLVNLANEAPPHEPHVVDDGTALSLHFESTLIQSRMLKADPDRLVFDYTRTMMGFLLFAPTPSRIAMIGLGGGSLAKACRRMLPVAHFTAVERSAAIIAMRDSFGIPADGPGFEVVCADGAEWVRSAEPAFDVLLVDGFDGNGQPPALCTAGFYADCAQSLSVGGILVVNLNADETGYGSYVRRIRDAFAGNIAVIRTADGENKIVFACRGGAFPPPLAVMEARASEEATFFLGLAETARRIDEAR